MLQLSASFGSHDIQHTKPIPGSQTCLGVRWQAGDSGPPRDTALDSSGQLEALIQGLFGYSELKRRRRRPGIYQGQREL